MLSRILRSRAAHHTLLGAILLASTAAAIGRPESLHPATVEAATPGGARAIAPAPRAAEVPGPNLYPLTARADDDTAPLRADFSRADALLVNGDYAAADAAFEPLTADPDAAVAHEALLRRAVAALLAHRYQDAADFSTALRDQASGSRPAAEAAMLLGLARTALGDCPGAIAAFEALAQEQPLLAAHGHSLAAECYAELDQQDGVAAAEQAVLDASPPRLLRLDALEHQAAAEERQGNVDGALDIYGRLLDESRTRSYTAQLLYDVALVHRDAGNTDRAVERLTQLVTDYPEQGPAAAALDRLNDLNQTDHISWFQAGLVRWNEGLYLQALNAFSQSLQSEAEAGVAARATFYKAQAEVRTGDTDGGVGDYVNLANTWPQDDLAPEALMKAGLAREADGDWDQAAELYGWLATSYPDSAVAADARFRHGFCAYAVGNLDGARSLWDAALNTDGGGAARARLLLWRGKVKAQQGDADAAAADWTAARDAAPDTFQGLRARDLIQGNAAATAWPPAQPAAAAGDATQVADWIKAQGADPQDLRAKIEAEPGFQRASALLRLGQRLRAGWEVEELLDAYKGKPATLYTLGTLLEARGAYNLSARVAQQALAALPDQSLLAAPAALQQLAYPLPYADLLDQQRQARGVDPLLMAALIRQESTYDPYATSSVGARGLTQVMPDTGAQIAAHRGEDFSVDDLYRPVVSVDYGAAFLSDVLDTFGGRVYPALASYNAGQGAAQRWIDAYGDDDPDLWAERIPYAETYHYVSIVFTNYGRYRLIYGAAN